MIQRKSVWVGIGLLLVGLIAGLLAWRSTNISPLDSAASAAKKPTTTSNQTPSTATNVFPSQSANQNTLPAAGLTPISKQPASSTPAPIAGSITRQSAPFASVTQAGQNLTATNPTSGHPEVMARMAAATSVTEVLQDADLTQPAIRAMATARISEIQDAQREAAYEKAARLGIPTRIEGPGRKVSLLYDFRGDVPLYRTTTNVNAAISSGANVLRDQGAPYGLDGTGMKVAVWDEAKIRNTHREFPNSRVTIKDSASTFSDHSTHVAGTIGASGTDAQAKGMAPKATIDSYDWNTDYAEMTAVGAATASEAGKISVSNHSYGAGFDTAAEYVPWMGRYETEANTTDALAVSLPYYQIFWAAGNEQDYLLDKGGYQSITFNGLAKNVITVAAGDDAVTGGARNPAVGTLAYFSSEGPCDDGRIKPDITANGVNLYSSISTSDTAYDGTYSGTSMATPNAVGSSILLEQLYGREFSGQRLRASTLKALLIETADDVGRPGPDYQYGWGYINVKAAADLILAHKASLASPKLIEGTITNASKTLTHSFTWDGTSPIRATLCWTDPAGAAQTAADSRTRNLVHDLDLKITAPDGTTTSLPYVMPFVGTWTTASMTANATTGVNKVDNVEQVYVDAPTQAGTYTMSVSLNGTLTTANQIYSLAVTGGSSVEANPPPSVTLDSPTTGTVVLPNVPVTLTATATDKAIGGGTGIVASVQFFNGATSLGIDTTAPYSLSWTPPAAGSYVLTALATDTEGAAATSAAVNLTVLSGNGTPTISTFSPTGGISGDVITITGTNFAAVSAVKFNGVDAQFTVVSPTSIAATVPATATTGTISVTTTFGSATSAGQFTIVQNPVLISQIYGGGGGNGATYNADYIELYNRGVTSVSVSGWSVQYASASGTSWQTAALSGSIAAGKYYLVKMTTGATGAALPTADATGALTLSGARGKVALRNTTTAFNTSSPVGVSGLQDFVGYGTANAYEGTGAAPSPSTTTAIFRAGGGATDAGNNATDFTVASPNPRNSSSGSLTAPVISSGSTASGVVSQAFSYQIAASNSPASFAASGLPAGLSVNTSTGLISGTPSAAGTSNTTISATNGAGTGNATLTITVTSGGGGGTPVLIAGWDFQTTLTGGTSLSPAPNTPTLLVANFGAGTLYLDGTNGSNSWVNASTGNELSAFGGTGQNAGQGFSTVTTGSSSLAILNSTANGKSIVFIFSMTGLKNLIVSYASQRTNSGFSSQQWDYSINGTTWTNIQTISLVPTSFATQTLATISGLDGAANAYLRLTVSGATTNSGNNRLDNIQLSATTSNAIPVISTSGTLTAVDTVYGTASPTPTSFAVSGANMTAAILVTAPPGFEVSQTAGGAAGYATTQTVGAAGTISPITIYLRFAANTAADSYAGNVICSSAGAVSVIVPVATSTVQAKTLIVAALDRSKPFGTTLTLGSSAFTPTGLVLGETVGSVTLSASGGTAANDPIGSYELTASNAAGGTFSASNYDISYQPGTLTVTGQDFSSWISGKYSGPAALSGADPEGDGISNLVEFFMGLDPALNDAPGTTNISLSVDQLSFTYRKSKSVTGTTGTVKWKNDLTAVAAWSASGVTDVLVSDQGAYEIRKASVTVGAGEASKFLRLEVTSP
ncbi:MAG: S8 family serine peptidase [Terrimicrobiaceae bacterium]